MNSQKLSKPELREENNTESPTGHWKTNPKDYDTQNYSPGERGEKEWDRKKKIKIYKNQIKS